MLWFIIFCSTYKSQFQGLIHVNPFSTVELNSSLRPRWDVWIIAWTEQTRWVVIRPAEQDEGGHRLSKHSSMRNFMVDCELCEDWRSIFLVILKGALNKLSLYVAPRSMEFYFIWINFWSNRLKKRVMCIQIQNQMVVKHRTIQYGGIQYKNPE